MDKNIKLSKPSCILLLYKHDTNANIAEQYCRTLFDIKYIALHSRSDKKHSKELLQVVQNENIDFLFNFLSPLIVQESVLSKINIQSLNFHPAPPEWPGVGSASYAIYNGDKTFGVTAHNMTKNIDGGEIVKTFRFPIMQDDTCETLFNRAIAYSLYLFFDVLKIISENKKAPPSGEKWNTNGTYKRKEFDKWITLTCDDTHDKVTRKVKAIKHSKLPGPYLLFHGYRFVLDSEQ